MTKEGNGKICPTCKGKYLKACHSAVSAEHDYPETKEKQAQAKHGIISNLMNESLHIQFTIEIC